ncbi:MAG: hypothetical protein HUU50_11460 [Candidatus Brocadiae bacterium]|nr:hypothetical protein [Candidatus Brocadiia bacterium]
MLKQILFIQECHKGHFWYETSGSKRVLSEEIVSCKPSFRNQKNRCPNFFYASLKSRIKFFEMPGGIVFDSLQKAYTTLC